MPDDVRKLANVVADHLQPLAEVGANRRARSNRLVPIATAHLTSAPLVRPMQHQQQQAAAPFGRLHELRVGPFRGFMQQEVFDLSHNITLLYGANGTGKSSFSEALETAMLGSINEAQAKRIDLRTYCDNARLRRHDLPSLHPNNSFEPSPCRYGHERTANRAARLNSGVGALLDTWQPITVAELEVIVAEQLAACSPQQQTAFATYRVPFYSMPLSRFGGVESALVVAELPGGLLYFEDVEEGFEVGVPGADGVLPDQGCDQLELTHVLYRAGF